MIKLAKENITMVVSKKKNALAFSGHSMGILFTGIISLGVYTGGYMAEVIRAGIEAIPKGQFEAADSQGFHYIGKMYYVILPQSIKIILLPMVNQVVNLIKNTSCLYIIGGADLISPFQNSHCLGGKPEKT